VDEAADPRPDKTTDVGGISAPHDIERDPRLVRDAGEPVDAHSDSAVTADEELEPEVQLAAMRTALPPRLERWRRRSATGAILTGIGLGLKAALEPERDEPSIVMQASGEPPTDLSVEAELGGIVPADNVVKIRPWLLNGQGPGEGDAAGMEAAGAQPGVEPGRSPRAEAAPQLGAGPTDVGEPAPGSGDTSGDGGESRE
jgi:hypothetical protein